MRMVDRAGFLALPAGTFFVKAGSRWAFGGLCIKDDNAGDNDWYELDPAGIASDDTGEWLDRLEEMERAGASYPMQDAVARDGLYEDGALFLIYERDDLLRLRDMVDVAIALEAA
jgi:hypothetical protein